MSQKVHVKKLDFYNKSKIFIFPKMNEWRNRKIDDLLMI